MRAAAGLPTPRAATLSRAVAPHPCTAPASGRPRSGRASAELRRGTPRSSESTSRHGLSPAAAAQTPAFGRIGRSTGRSRAASCHSAAPVGDKSHPRAARRTTPHAQDGEAALPKLAHFFFDNVLRRSADRHRGSPPETAAFRVGARRGGPSEDDWRKRRSAQMMAQPEIKPPASSRPCIAPTCKPDDGRAKAAQQTSPAAGRAPRSEKSGPMRSRPLAG